LSLASLSLSIIAEPFGNVSGAIGITSAFTAYVGGFEYVQFGRRFSQDFQTSQLALNLKARAFQPGLI
jgi:hypothetical protein